MNKFFKLLLFVYVIITSSTLVYSSEDFFDEAIIMYQNEKYEEEEINNYDDNIVTPNYEDFAFAPSAHGSGFVVGNGKYVITNHHVIDGAKKVAVRNGIGKVKNAKVVAYSKDYDLAILELESPYPKAFSINEKDFEDPKVGAF